MSEQRTMKGKTEQQDKQHAPKRSVDQGADAGQSEHVEDRQRDEATTDADVGAAAPEGVDEATPDPNTPEGMKARIEALEDSLLRAKADYQNLQRRMQTERSDAIRFANADLMRALLPVLDDFERSLHAAETTADPAAFVEGIRLIYENFRKALTDHGLEPIEALKQPFDPGVHEALMQQPSDEHPPGTVLEEVTPGYKLRDRVIRPTRVIVARAPEVATGSGDSKSGRNEESD